MKDLSELLNISYPVVQAPMLGVTTPAMVAAVSNGGGLGCLPIGGLSPEKALTLIRETKAISSKPFVVNLFAHSIAPEVPEEDLKKWKTISRLSIKNMICRLKIN